MKVYLDIIFFVNLIFDFILLLSLSIILKRNIKIIKILIGSLFGSITTFTLFINMTNIELFIFKIVVSIFMVLITFGFNNIKYFFKNIYYFYTISIIMGGFIYFINNQFSYNNGLVFLNNYKTNILFGIIVIIVGMKFYIKNIKELKINYNKYLKAKIFFNNYSIDVNAFVDTGNKLKDPYSFKPIILVDENIIKSYNNYIYVPFKTCNNSGLLKCIKAKSIYIEGIGYKKNFLVGLSNEIKIDGINCLLNERIMEG